MSRFAGWDHCPRCRAPLAHGRVPHDEDERLHCPACGLVLYDNPAPTVAGLVVRDGLVMLTRRAREPAAGTWDLPGGFVEPGEHPADALVRELREETGLDVRVSALVDILPDAYGPAGTPTLNLFYTAEPVGGEERPLSDVSEIAWFAPAAVPPAEAIGFPCCARALERFLRSGEPGGAAADR